ncbi:MAG: hypothetical protein K9K84_06275 [Methylovulum sp.]|nr:hypothetical protein [Methylovulum sp.]
MKTAITGSSVDYTQHQRGTAKGDEVTEEWSPSLGNAAGMLQKPPLVNTQ